jgi:hypothetical protein
MAVTAFKGCVSYCAEPTNLYNAEKKEALVVPANDAIGFDWWVPWATNQQEYNEHHIKVEALVFPRNTYTIWQAGDEDGDFVRYTNIGKWVFKGLRIPGVSEVGGNRLLKIHPNGTISCLRSG